MLWANGLDRGDNGARCSRLDGAVSIENEVTVVARIRLLVMKGPEGRAIQFAISFDNDHRIDGRLVDIATQNSGRTHQRRQ